MGGAQSKHDFGDITPRVDDLTGDLDALGGRRVDQGGKGRSEHNDRRTEPSFHHFLPGFMTLLYRAFTDHRESLGIPKS